MKYRIELCGVWPGSVDPMELTEIIHGEVEALKRFEEMEIEARQSGCIAFKLCLNLEGSSRWKSPIRYLGWPLGCAQGS